MGILIANPCPLCASSAVLIKKYQNIQNCPSGLGPKSSPIDDLSSANYFNQVKIITNHYNSRQTSPNNFLNCLRASKKLQTNSTCSSLESLPAPMQFHSQLPHTSSFIRPHIPPSLSYNANNFHNISVNYSPHTSVLSNSSLLLPFRILVTNPTRAIYSRPSISL